MLDPLKKGLFLMCGILKSSKQMIDGNRRLWEERGKKKEGKGRVFQGFIFHYSKPSTGPES
jgi:hypothetical protein